MREITIRGVDFKINKMLPVPAEDLLIRHVRPLMGGAMSAETDGSDSGGWKLLLAAFANAPYDHYVAVRDAMFRCVEYRRKDNPAWRVLSGDMEAAFVGLLPVHITQIAVEAFAENFTESYSELQSLLPRLITAMSGPET